MKSKLIWTVVLLALIGGTVYLATRPVKPGELDGFASCLSEKGVKFFGAFWCPHCQNQKAAFGRSARLLPYIECSTPDGKGRLPVCEEAGVVGYPTWEFPDGTRKSGEVSLEDLSLSSSCPLPQDEIENVVEIEEGEATEAIEEITEV